MALVYKHGVYAEQQSSIVDPETTMSNLPAYIGTLPIQHANVNGAASFDYSPYINKPILITSMADVNELGLYSDDWETYTLGEVISAHLLNGNNVVAPFVLINMLDPATHVASATESATVTLETEGANKVGYINDPKGIIDGIALTIEGLSPEISASDYTLAYEGDSIKITITRSGVTQTSLQATYKQIEIEDADITDTVFEKAVKALDYCELLTGYIPNILAAPHWSKIASLHDVMLAKTAERISKKWSFITVSDIPADGTTNDITKAIAWKKTNGYRNKYDKVCFPMVTYDGQIYHLSTIASFTMQATDLQNDDSPYVSPSNKNINADGACLADGTQLFISETEANQLNEEGITSVNIIRRRLRLWGSHMSNYEFANLDNISYEDRSDSNIRMMLYLMNYLQYNYIDDIDTSFARKDVDSVLTSVQQWLNSLVNENKLLYATVSFNESENSTENLVNGDFVFDVASTLVPNAKSFTFKVNYTTEGLALLTGGTTGGEA